MITNNLLGCRAQKSQLSTGWALADHQLFGRKQRVLKADAAKAPEQIGLVQQEAA